METIMTNSELEKKFYKKLNAMSDEELRERLDNAPPSGIPVGSTLHDLSDKLINDID